MREGGGVTGNLAGLLDEHARGRPSHPALIEGDRCWSYGGLAPAVRRMAEALAREGVGRGTLLGVGLRDRAAHVLALFAAMRLGAVIVSVDWRWSAEEMRGLAGHFALSHLMVEADAPEVPGPRRIAVTEAWLAAAEALAGAAPLAEGADLPMLLSLSSGTTGRPTGPLLTHAQMWARTENQLVTLTFHQHDRYLLATPLYFGGGRAFVLSHLTIGATVILAPPPLAPEALAAEIGRTGATSTFLVPTQIRRLLDLEDGALAGLEGLRLLISSGAPLHPEERAEIERRLCPGFIEYFASTEGGGISIMTAEERRARPESVGRAGFRVALEVVGEDHGALPPGEAGLVRYRGPGVATGLHGDPTASAEAFRDGWFYPGDIGRMDAEGYLTLLGRAKSVIIRGGVNIYPVEIERALATHPDVREAAVYGVPDREMGEEVCAAVVGAASETALRAHCAARLAPYKVPRRWRFLDALPRNSAGKVRLDALRRAD